MGCPSCNQNTSTPSVPCAECNPVQCPTPQPCVEVVSSECVLHVGENKFCGTDKIYSKGDSLAKIFGAITDYYCGKTHVPEDKYAGGQLIYAEGDDVNTSLENIVDYFQDLFSTLPSPTGATIVDITHAALLNLKINGLLQRGEFYRITDFATKYELPDYTTTGAPVTTPILQTEVVSPIIVFAISANQLRREAIDLAFPKDIVHYELEYTTPKASYSTLGRIVYRKDEHGNETDYDHRRVRFKRYKDALNVYSSYYDLGFGSQLFTTFNTTSPNIVRNVTIKSERLSTSVLFDLPNIIFAKSVDNVLLGTDSENGTFLDNVSNASFVGGFYGNLFNSTCKNVSFTGLFRNNNINAMLNVTGLEFDNNITKNTFKNVVLEMDVTNTDFTSALHVYANYNKKIYMNSANGLRLSYYDSVDSEQIANITD